MSARFHLSTVQALLHSGQTVAWQKLDSIWHRQTLALVARTPIAGALALETSTRRQVLVVLRGRLTELNRELGRRQRLYRDYAERLAVARDRNQRERVMLEFLKSLGASRRALRGDAAAFSRWFGSDGVTERFDYQRARIEREVVYLLSRVGELLAQELDATRDQAQEQRLESIGQLEFDDILLEFLGYPGDERVRMAVLSCMRRAFQPLGVHAKSLIDSRKIAIAYKSAMDFRQPTWLQCEALELLAVLAPEDLPQVLQPRLHNPQSGDDLFFRRRAFELIARLLNHRPELEPLFELGFDDASPHVRQGLVESIGTLSDTHALAIIARLQADPDAAVTTALMVQMPKQIHRIALHAAIVAALIKLAQHTERQVVRAAMHLMPKVIEAWQAWMSTLGEVTAASGVDAESARQQFIATLEPLHQTHERTDIRRYAARAIERLWALDGRWSTARMALQDLRHLGLGKVATVRHRAVQDLDEMDLARLLQTMADGGFGFDILQTQPVLKVRREYRFAPRLWRFLAEWRRPASDKRQNYSHLRGRVYEGLTVVPASSVAELSITKVPGEPLHLSEEGGYRPYLPLVDHAISALDQGWPAKPVRIVSSEGVTELTPPNGLWARLKAKWKLSNEFEKFARLRNWTTTSTFKPESYLQALLALGFQVRVRAHVACPASAESATQDIPKVDSRVRRFFPPQIFPALIPFDQISGMVGDFKDYFYSVYQNSLGQLLVFLAGMFTVVFGQHFWLNGQFRMARKHIPFVVGGWGTRGKSGTERLKAAVFSAMGYQILSKTTGCEAMFLYGYPLRKTREMFLFRPYDKATIWEQLHLTKLAKRLGTEVMLWECMGLNPRYVRILQHQWMRDDLATITNCYPDHEDIQGPAGIDLPQVIGQFMPVRGVCATSEENMLPYLQEIAHNNQTELHCVDWLEAGLIAPDVLARYPYEEHPYNIALVIRMFATLDIPADFALKEMADRVVPDLGVLKAYPIAHLRGRQLEFVNGCSANERHGTLSNWVRMGFDQHRIDRDPNVWVSTVVNNRADRVARSQVFAGILVNDIGADRHYLIGGNLDGLQTYIENSFNAFADQLDWRANNEAERDNRQAQFAALLTRWRIAKTNDEAVGRLRAILLGSGMSDVPDAIELQDTGALDAIAPSSLDAEMRARIWAQWQSDLDDAKRATALSERFAIGDNQALRDEIRTQLWTWFRARIIVVEDYYTTGNQLIDRVTSNSPPGLLARVMGVQNIKGTGLDFVYRWQAWNENHRFCRELLSDDPEVALAGAKGLSASHELGLVDEPLVRATLEKVRAARLAQSGVLLNELRAIEQTLDAQIAHIKSTMNAATAATVKKTKRDIRFEKAVVMLENFLDAGDAVRRRNHAQRVYEDLAHHRISLPKAVKELQDLTKRQKGGWLIQALQARREAGG